MMYPHGPEHYHAVLNKLSSLPKKMLSLHGHEYVTHFVMHELCNEPLLNIERAAYFVDNPDFNCLQGVAGFCKKEAYNGSCDIWRDQESFVDVLKASTFNNNVKDFKKESMKKKGNSDDTVVHEIANTFNIHNPGYYSWDMKHDNHGLFVFQKNDVPEKALEYLSDTVCLLGFCPVF